MMGDQVINMLKHAGLAIVALVTHAAVAAVGILTSWGLEFLIHYLHPDKAPKVFGFIPLESIVQGGEVGLFVGVMVFGIKSALDILRSH